MNVIFPPDDKWVMRLAKGHFIYLCKEKIFAQVALPYIPDSRYPSGEIAIQKIWGTPRVSPWGLENVQIWIVYPDGTGLDRRPLITPVEGNLLNEPVVRCSELEMKIADLEARLANVERDYLRTALRESYGHN